LRVVVRNAFGCRRRSHIRTLTRYNRQKAQSGIAFYKRDLFPPRFVIVNCPRGIYRRNLLPIPLAFWLCSRSPRACTSLRSMCEDLRRHWAVLRGQVKCCSARNAWCTFFGRSVL
jgi:hypothetical protein